MKSLFALFLTALFVTTMAQPIPRPEHPRPDLRREEWTSLNGQWEFGETDDDADDSWLTKEKYPDKIIVPFCRESKLSGLERKGFVRNVWYRRRIEVPKSWKSNHVLLHIGASDWKTTVYVNRKLVVTHTGGQTPIDLDITMYLDPTGNDVIVHAFDDTRSGLQALGKQCPAPDSYGCLYTRTTGIWQSVWLEGAGASWISNMTATGDMNGEVSVTVNIKGVSKIQSGPDGALPRSFKDRSLRAELYWGTKRVATHVVPKANPNQQFGFHFDNPKLWAPGRPNLYRLKLTLLTEDAVSDVVESNVGFRTVSVDHRSILINGKRVFQRLVLDQGFYPDGVWTAPSDETLKHDIEMSMAAGFNGARLHQKVFEPRYLYWADKLGYMVWGEYPNWGMNYTHPAVERPVLEEWTGILNRDMSHPSIVGWCPFNETPPEAVPLQNKVVAITQARDISRPVIDSSGYAHDPAVTPVLDAHDYDQNPVSFKNRWDSFFGQNALPKRYAGNSSPSVPFMVSEYGGIGWDSTGGWGYGEGPKSLDEFYKRFKGLTDALLDNPEMFGFCYTQITDVEQEKNGIYKYDRTPKFDVKKLHAILARPAAYETQGPSTPTPAKDDWQLLVKSARDGGSAWKSTTSQPSTDWNQSEFADASWYVSPGGFGQKGGWEKESITTWDTPDIWLRQTFKSPSGKFDRAMIAIHYDNAAEVYVNGKLVWKSAAGAWNDAYEGIDVTSALKKALRRGDNVIAVHCHQDTGGQFIDLALLVR